MSEKNSAHVEDVKTSLPATEYDANIGDGPVRTLQSFWDTDKLTEDDKSLVRIMDTHETLLEALRAIQTDNEQLVADLPGDSCCWCCSWNTTILEGQIGCATRFGKAFFIGPGNYFRMPVGVTLEEVKDIETQSESGTNFTFKDVSYLNLAENNVAVVQVGERLLILGSGRYLLRHPAVSYGMVNVQNLTQPVEVKQILEIAGEVKKGQDPRDVVDVQQEVKLVAGRIQHVNSVTFVRASPGFCFVIQDSQGRLRSGIGFTVCRGGEKFLDFVDRQHYARTTQRFTMESIDRQEVTVRAQIRWRLEKAKLWQRYKGVSRDVFHALQETIQSLLRDAVAGSSYEECSTTGYAKVEQTVFNELQKQTSRLGARLLGFEIRELRFQLLEKKNLERAEKESLMDEKLYEERRNLDIETENRQRIEAKRVYDFEIEQMRLSHRAELQILKDRNTLAAMTARAKLEEEKEKLDLKKQELKLSALGTQQDILLQIEEAHAKAEAKASFILQSSISEVQLEKDHAEAKELTIKGSADAKSKTILATADASATKLIASAYGNNPNYLQLEGHKLHAQVMKQRAQAMFTALGANSASFMPLEYQRELSFLNKGISPIAPMVIPVGSNGAGVVVCSPDTQADMNRNVQLTPAPGPPRAKHNN